MPVRAIVCDIDGCLGPESHGPLDASGLAALAEINRRACDAWDRAGGAPVMTLCSGRPQPYAEAMSRLIGNTRLPIVAEMGVWLYDPRDNRFIIDPTISDRDMEMIAACATWVRRELSPLGVVMQPGKTASISLWHPSTPTLLGLSDGIRERCGREGWTLRISNTVAWINLELAHVSKGTGLDRLMQMCNLRREELAGIGDTLGDMAIRERVGWFACPSNADERLKAAADYVSGREEIGGVLEIVGRVGRG